MGFDFDGDIDVPFSDLMRNQEIRAAARRVHPLLLLTQGTVNVGSTHETIINIITCLEALSRCPDTSVAQVGGLIVARSREMNGYVIGVAATHVASFRVNMEYRVTEKRRKTEDGETNDDGDGGIGTARVGGDEVLPQG